LALGVAWSKPAAIQAASGSDATAGLMIPGQNLLLWAATRLFHGTLQANEVLNLHPFALAAWVGLLVTALNLLPLGQLDGGHILYAAIGRRQHQLALPVWLALVALCWFSWGWVVWSAIVFLLGIRHPPLASEAAPLDGKRRALALLALLLFLISFAPVPLTEVAVR
jgi:membrane-associated protease RseP (regulator of RpoE activity)